MHDHVSATTMSAAPLSRPSYPGSSMLSGAQRARTLAATQKTNSATLRAARLIPRPFCAFFLKAQRAQSRAAEQLRNPSIEAASACPFCAFFLKAQRAQSRAAEQLRNPSIEAASACPFCAFFLKAQRAQSRAAEQLRNPSIEAASACPFCAFFLKAQRAQSRAAEQLRNPSIEAASACPFCAFFLKAQRAQSRAAEQLRNPSIEAASACPFCAFFLKAASLFFLTSLLLQPQAAPANPPAPADQPETPAPVTCPAGTPIGAINLKVRSQKSPDPLPFQTINHLSEGDIVLYSPIIKGKQKRVGEVALVMVPAKKDPKSPQLLVTDPRPADKPQEWKIPQTIELAAFVYGPGGLSRKKVEGFLSQDDQLVAQLADYAAKTSETEALLAALSNDGSSSAGMNAALNGFASQYGLSVQIDRTAPPAVQAQTLFATMNPQLATYNPLATSSSAERLGQTASIATAAATLFFGSPIGLAAGGTAMLLDLRYIAFPNTVFRSSFAQTMPSKGLNLCGQGGGIPPHTRIAYIWASRIPNTPDPEIKIKDADYIPQTLKTAVPVDVPDKEWKYLERARQWSLVNDKGVKTKINVIKLGNQHSIEVDLDKVALAAGDYKLHGFWDWSEFEAKGDIHVRPLSDFKDAHLLAASQDKLLAHSGKVAVTLADSDFEFTRKIEEKKLNDEFAVAEPVRFILPTGLNKGPQKQIDVQIDTASLDPGKYQLLIAQEDGKSHPIPFNILPNAPKIENLPILINQGVDTQHFVLKGERLQLISRLESPLADLHLAPASPDGVERSLTVQLKGNLSPGKSEAIQAYMSDRTEPLTLADALQITGPLPVIASSKLSLPTGMQISLLPSEFPAGATLTALLDVKNIKPKSILHLDCQEDIGSRPALHIGEQNATSSLQQLSPDQLFVSFDTSAFPAGCTLLASIDNSKDGKSQPQVLAHIIRLPQIATFQMVNPQSYQLTGLNLEMIQKVGWDDATGTPVPGLPSPIPGQGQQQSLQINLPDPPNPKATLYIWLHGEPTGRATTITLPPTPPSPVPPQSH